MPNLLCIPWNATWVSTYATIAAALFAAAAVKVAWQTMKNATKQSNATTLAEQLAYLSTGDIAKARSRIFAHTMTPHSAPLRKNKYAHPQLSDDERDDVFKLLWAIQRVGVIAPVLEEVDDTSKAVLEEQVDQIVSTLHLLGRTLHPDDAGKFSEAVGGYTVKSQQPRAEPQYRRKVRSREGEAGKTR